MKKTSNLVVLLLTLLTVSCGNSSESENNAPTVGFIDFVQDPTIELAKNGFYDAMEQNGFSEKEKTINYVYTNAQGDIPTLNQACDRILAADPDIIATNVTLSTITAAKRTKKTPIFMMVSPRPDLAGLTDRSNKHQDNLSGVYETLEYLDSAVIIVKQLFPNTKRIGSVFNQAEPQSQAAFNRIYKKGLELGIEVISLPVNNSAETQLVTEALLMKQIDVFFALPDNVIFASFETVERSCSKAKVPIITSEAGLVSRGALASYGADFYQWGYQSGQMAAAYLKSERKNVPKPTIVRKRQKIYNPEVATRFGINPDSSFTPFNP